MTGIAQSSSKIVEGINLSLELYLKEALCTNRMKKPEIVIYDATARYLTASCDTNSEFDISLTIDDWHDIICRQSARGHSFTQRIAPELSLIALKTLIWMSEEDFYRNIFNRSIIRNKFITLLETAQTIWTDEPEHLECINTLLSRLNNCDPPPA